jgi:choline-sulfatase
MYMWLHEVVDVAIARVLGRLSQTPGADDTIVVFTSDHGDMLGAHGGMQQKWHTGFDEAIRVPMVVAGPGIAAGGTGLTVPTSSVDVLPTLLGLAGLEVDALRDDVSAHHIETQPLPGRDLSAALRGECSAAAVDDAIYFMTEDQISLGLRGQNRFTGEPFEPVAEPCKVETVVGRLSDGSLWKLNHYYDHLLAWETEHGVPSGERVDVDDEWELYDLTNDPEERTNLAAHRGPVFDEANVLLDEVRDRVRRVPRHRNG